MSSHWKLLLQLHDKLKKNFYSYFSAPDASGAPRGLTVHRRLTYFYVFLLWNAAFVMIILPISSGLQKKEEKKSEENADVVGFVNPFFHAVKQFAPPPAPAPTTAAEKRPLKERFRALFTLRNINSEDAIDAIVSGFSDSSALLKHECAYCLGQMQNVYAVPPLVRVLQDEGQEVIVRHEAGEALGAIGCGSDDVLAALTHHSQSHIQELAETCQLALQRIQWQQEQAASKELLSTNPYKSIDPAPPMPVCGDVTDEAVIDKLRGTLLNRERSLFDRYRALFTLRNMGGAAAARAISAGLQCDSSALLRHEVAYVLGQMQEVVSVGALAAVVRDVGESGMVRHECAEALGAIASEECMRVLEEYRRDGERLVRESCEVALDMCDYHNSTQQFHFMDGNKHSETGNATD